MSWDTDGGGPPSGAAFNYSQSGADFHRGGEVRIWGWRKSAPVSSLFPLSQIFLSRREREREMDSQKGQTCQATQKTPHTVCAKWLALCENEVSLMLVSSCGGESDARLSRLTESLWRERSCAVPLWLCVWCQAYAASLRPATNGWCHMSLLVSVGLCACEQMCVNSLANHHRTKTGDSAKLWWREEEERQI